MEESDSYRKPLYNYRGRIKSCKVAIVEGGRDVTFPKLCSVSFNV